MILLIIYLISVVVCWQVIRVSYSKGGVLEDLDVDFFDFLITFTPIANIAATVLYTLFVIVKRIGSFNKFFKIKK